MHNVFTPPPPPIGPYKRLTSPKNILEVLPSRACWSLQSIPPLFCPEVDHDSTDPGGHGGSDGSSVNYYPLAFLRQNLERANILVILFLFLFLFLVIPLILLQLLQHSPLSFLLIKRMCKLPLNTRKHSKCVVGASVVNARSTVDGGCYDDKEVLKVFFKLS